MASVVLLVEGYVKDGGKRVQGTVSLVQDGDVNLIVDPGMTKDSLAIIKALKKYKLTSNDVQFVVITHHHPDHTRNVGLFPNATLIDYASQYKNDTWIDLSKGEYQITPNVNIVATPGHTKEDATIIVSNVANIETDESVAVGICHLWWYKGKDDDPTAQNMEALKRSKKKILKRVNYIVPGHGNLFKVK